jgi:spermidine synthase
MNNVTQGFSYEAELERKGHWFDLAQPTLTWCSNIPTPYILTLGLGTGFVQHSAARTLQNPQQTIIELDPTIIKINKTHFKFDEIPNTTVIIGDAYEKIKDIIQTHQKYDAVILDIYSGEKQNLDLEDKEKVFMHDLYTVMKPKSILTINRPAHTTQYHEEAQQLAKLLKKIYDQVDVVFFEDKYGYKNFNIIAKKLSLNNI